MNRILDVGYVLKISDKDYIIKKVVGKGASSVTYLAEHNKTEHILKECNPLGISMHRNEDGVLIADTKLGEEKFFDCRSRFKAGVDNHLLFRLTDDLKNVTSNIQDVYDVNGTLYIDMTFFDGDTYDNVVDKTLYDIFRRMKALAQVVGHYHKLGYLHLDIKPQNIYTIPETPEMVMMFDFDSVVQQDDIDALISSSYTDAWAAPEQKMRKYRNQICNATDFFAIGEIIFYKLFGRHSTEEDRYSFSQYEYASKNKLFENVNPKAFPMITELFHKTLSCSVKKRYKSAGELISKLDELIELTKLNKPYLKSSFVVPKTFFIGRDVELAVVHESFQKSNIQFLSGIGGIGKSELAKNYAKIHVENGDYNTVLFTTYNGSWMMLINDDSSINITNFERFPEEKELDYYRRKMRKLGELVDERTLFIIDNLNEDEFEGEVQKQWKDILGLGCKILITTRQQEWNYPIQYINIFTERENLIALFQNYCDIKIEADLKAVQEIIDYVGGHTLTIELIARQTKASFLTPEEMLVKLKEHGISKSGKEKIMSEKDSHQSRKTAFEHITSLFDIADLNEQEKYVLTNMSLIPSEGIKAELFAEWCELKDYDAVNSLIGSGWMERDEDAIKMHPVVAEVAIVNCLSSMPELCKTMLENLTEYLEPYANRNYQSYMPVDRDMIFFCNLAKHIVCQKIELEIIPEILTNISKFISEFGNIDEVALCRKYAIEVCLQLYGEDDSNTATAISNLGIFYRDIGDYERALHYLNKSTMIRKRIYGFKHIDVASSFNSLAMLYLGMGDTRQALHYAKKAFRIKKKLLGYKHSSIAVLLSNIGLIYKSLGNFGRAKHYYQKALDIQMEISGVYHLNVATYLNNLAMLYREIGDYEQALEYSIKGLDIREGLLGQHSIEACQSLDNIGSIYGDMGDFGQAIVYSKKSLEGLIMLCGEQHPTISTALCNAGYLHEMIGELDRAENYYSSAYEMRKELLGNNHEQTKLVKERLLKILQM